MEELERNKEVVRTAWRAFDACDESAFAACFANGWVERDASGAVATLADANESMRRHRTAFPDKRTTIERIVAEGDLVVTYTTTAATHLGEYDGVAPTGRRVSFQEMLICRIAGGLIAESWQTVSGGIRDQIAGTTARTGERD
ncbi:MAG: ester cyclase [Chloroflexota bacterium]|nr:ester cyclase [Chloroflexota bacterium]